MKDTGERLIAKGNEQSLTYGEHWSRYRSVLPIVKGQRVLDVASGSGYGSRLLATTAKHVTGIDRSSAAITYAQQTYSAPNVTFLRRDAHRTNLPSRAFDTVVSFETIEHLKNPAQFVGEIKRVLKRRGVFVVSTPNKLTFMEGNSFHVHEFQLAELTELLERHFQNCQTYYQGTWLAASIVSEQHLTATWQDMSLPLAKTFTQQPEQAAFFVMVASDGLPPPLTEYAVLADSWSRKDYLKHEANQRRIIQGLTRRNKALKRALRDQSNTLQFITHTRWWRVRQLVPFFKTRVQ